MKVPHKKFPYLARYQLNNPNGYRETIENLRKLDKDPNIKESVYWGQLESDLSHIGLLNTSGEALEAEIDDQEMFKQGSMILQIKPGRMDDLRKTNFKQYQKETREKFFRKLRESGNKKKNR